MKRELMLISFIFAIYLFSLNFVVANNFTNSTIEVSVNIPATEEWAEVQLNTTSIDFGSLNLSEDASSTVKEAKAKYKIRNRGNVNITVTPVIENKDDLIFKNLFFARTYTSGWEKVGSYSINMNKTTVVGEWQSWIEQSVKLDLENYTAENGQVPFDINNHKSNIIFWVMPRYD